MKRQTPLYLVDLFGLVVTSTQAAFGMTAGGTPVPVQRIHYEYGPIDEIRASLKEMSEYPDVTNPKYPLIALYDWDEVRGEDVDCFSTATVKFIVATLTDQTWKAGTRYTNSFKSTLVPIFMELLRQMEISGYFKVHQDPRLVKHGYKEELDYGCKQEFVESVGAVDFIDAISIKQMVLKINPVNQLR